MMNTCFLLSERFLLFSGHPEVLLSSQHVVSEQKHLDAFVHHRKKLLAELFTSEALSARQFLLLPLRELV